MVLTSAARILLKHEDKVIEEERELQEEMPEESFLFRKRSSETGGHGHDIDNPATGLHEKDKEFEKEENNEEVIGENNNGNNGKGETKGKKRQEEEKREEKEEEEEEEKGEERERTKNKNRLTERNFPADYTFANGRLWPNGVVPYAVDETSYSTEISSFNSLLGQTIELFDRETCISFKPKTDSLLQSLGHQNFVTFYNGSGCSSPVGVSSGKISINYPGCTYVGTFFHEMCHTIGMMHEQSRIDRNLQMLVKWANIKNGKQGNFVKSNTKTHDNVDLHSVMQYSLWSFSKNNEQTITLKNDDYQFLVNSNRNYSFYDIADINYVYQCSDSCTTKPACKYYGFVNKDCKCRCPDGLKGDLCNEIDGNCGGFIDLTSGSSQNITSSNWPNQHNAPADHRVKVKILEMDLAYTAKSNLMMIKFDSLYANDKPPAKGFKLEATAFKSGCLKRPCKMGGTCVEGNNDFTYTCVCPPGYSGEMDNVPANDSGVYAYVSWPGNPSKMVSDVNFEATDRCLVFDYYNTGTLKVFYESSDFSGRREALATGTTSEWTKANVHFPNVNGLKITFEGEYGDGNLKAVDNVVIVPGVCANLTSFTCSSEPENSCFLTDADNDDQNWKVQTLQTPSSGTGPSSAFQGNYYRYLEASYVEPGKKAILINSMRDLPVLTSAARILLKHEDKATGLHEKDKEFEKEENNEEVIGENNNGNNGKGETKGKKRQEEEKREEKEEEEEEEKVEERERTKNKNRLTERNFPADYTFANGRLWPNGVVPYAVDETSYSGYLLS
ncbi:hypothetical protein KUTeg_006711 [Tegillarca granosa]|uniref:Metalloendopeptidase n=1 Tax=Tegillarca granosa TaxID=220873 RepID=A0ABQ9FEB7_TEGGR|nr:hypothetical protein KUTeg_006711 [Tegillarca granosa]